LAFDIVGARWYCIVTRMHLTDDERDYLSLIREASSRRFEQRMRASEQGKDAPSLPPPLPTGSLAKMSPDEQADYLHSVGMASLRRYGGRSDLLMEETPRRDFRWRREEQRIREAEAKLRRQSLRR